MFISFGQELEIREYPNYPNKLKMLLVKGNLDISNLKSSEIEKQYYIDDTALEIISLIDGTRKLDEIVKILSKKYVEDYNSISCKVIPFIGKLSFEYGIKINKQNTPKKRTITYSTYKTMYPLIATIELTVFGTMKTEHSGT